MNWFRFFILQIVNAISGWAGTCCLHADLTFRPSRKSLKNLVWPGLQKSLWAFVRIIIYFLNCSRHLRTQINPIEMNSLPFIDVSYFTFTEVKICVVLVGSSTSTSDITSITSPGCLFQAESYSSYQRMIRFAYFMRGGKHADGYAPDISPTFFN